MEKNKEKYISRKTINNIVKVKMFRLLPLSAHNIGGHIRFNSYRAMYNVVKFTSCTRFSFYNKD